MDSQQHKQILVIIQQAWLSAKSSWLQHVELPMLNIMLLQHTENGVAKSYSL